MKRLPALHSTLFAACVLLLSTPARAEYRVYQLVITDTKTAQTRVVTSTLDHIQYSGYFNLRPGETVALQDSWMCWSRSDGMQPLCSNPREPSSAPPSAKSAPAAP